MTHLPRHPAPESPTRRQIRLEPADPEPWSSANLSRIKARTLLGR